MVTTKIKHKFDVNESVWFASIKDKKEYCCKTCGQHHMEYTRVPIKTKIISFYFFVYDSYYELSYHIEHEDSYYSEAILFKTKKECQKYIDDNYGGIKNETL